jgi:biopolymer transport protein ExbD
MTDIAFLLLLFFLIMAVTTRLTPIPLDRATSGAGTKAEDSVALVVGKDGTLYYGDLQVSTETMPYETEMTILADKDTPFSVISPILGLMQENGVETIHCLVGERP